MAGSHCDFVVDKDQHVFVLFAIVKYEAYLYSKRPWSFGHGLFPSLNVITNGVPRIFWSLENLMAGL